MPESTYVPPIVTVDAVLFRVAADELEVLTHVRERDPFAGAVALPGVYVQSGETILDAARRAITTKTDAPFPEAARISGVHDSTARDPRGHAISIVTVGFCAQDHPGSGWRPAAEPFDAFDHTDIVTSEIARLRTGIWTDTTALPALVSPKQLHTGAIKNVIEAVIGVPVDTPNLGRKLDNSGVFARTGETVASGKGRPAALWKPTTVT